MFVYVGGRQSGKTNALVRWFLEQPRGRCVVVADSNRRNHFLHTLYRLSGFTRVQFRMYEDNVVVASQVFSRAFLRGRALEVGVDDAEAVFEVLFGVRIDFVAMNATLLDFKYTTPEDRDEDYLDGEVIPDYGDESVGRAKAIERPKKQIGSSSYFSPRFGGSSKSPRDPFI